MLENKLLEQLQRLYVDKDHLGRVTPAFFAQSPQTIKYAKQPPKIKDEVIEMDRHQFEALNKLKWTDSLLLPAQDRDNAWADRIYSKGASKYIEERLHQPL